MTTRGLIMWVSVWVAHGRMRQKRDGEASEGDLGTTIYPCL